MTTKKTITPPGGSATSQSLIGKILQGTHDHYTCLLPDNIGRFTGLLLKLFYSGIKVDKEQTETIRQLDKNAIVVYVTKFKSYFEYLLYYSRYRQEDLPHPQIGFDYKVYLWQPFSRILRILLARLDFFIRHQSLPDPYERGYFKQELINGRSGLLSLVGKKGFYRRFVKAQTDPIQYLVETQKSVDRPIYLIPQLIFFSKTARREIPTLIDILFGPEDKPGTLRRLFTLFKNPGKVFVEVSKPVNLQSYLQSDQLRPQTTEYQSLILRRDLLVQLNRHRQSITGPIRKSKEELKESILTNDRLKEYMNRYAESRNISIHEVHRKADGYLEEIAANYKPAFIKIASVIVGWITRNMFDGVAVNYRVLNQVKQKALNGPLLLIPCHKSHIDYLILDYVLYNNNMPVPHIAAGKNLSFWPMGPIFRSGGAFFLRRTFGGAVLYSKVFAEYIHKLLQEGYNIEQFIEGGRSRTGKLLMPKLGLLSILVNAYKIGACDDMLIVPIYIGYDRIVEEKSYLHELGGGQKESENILQVIQARKFLKKRYGKIYIQFHEPISLNKLQRIYDRPLAEMNSKEQNRLIRDLGYQVINAINRVTVVTPHAVVASAILNFSTDTFSFSELLAVNEIYLRYLTAQNAKLADTLVSDHLRVFEQVVDLYCQRKFIEPLAKGKENNSTDRHFLINKSRRLNLEYYKNNCIAFFIPAAYTAMAILEKDAFRFSASELHTGFEFWQDFFKYEFAYDVENRPEYNVRKSIKAFIDNAVVVPHKTLPGTYDITPAALRKLNLFSLFLKTYFESYWIVLSYYKRNPQSSTKPKDRLKKIAARGNRMYKRKEIDRKEALSKVSYQNAVEFFTSKGIKGSDDTKKIEVYAEAIQKALKHLRP
ncbi:Glycerol-3-phosphate acyltransferase (EC [Olavius sp. associated proteobacterium Delta 1]|nr:Glycerol-3-phosphate acyltransferase (EC [Olavius sp. associated proteobacterium Delta 1]